MSDSSLKFRNKYRIESTRMKDWDYSTPGFYFITICTQDHIPWFGKIIDGKTVLSPAGKIVDVEIQSTTRIRPYVKIDTWVVMPNHIHAIVEIVETPRRGVSTKATWKTGTLGAIINQFKSKCTKRIHVSGIQDFAWQRRFYDRIIRDENSLTNIYLYIIQNPTTWSEDEYFTYS